MEGERNTAGSRLGVGTMAFTLWAATAVIGLLEINIIVELVLRTYARFWADYGIYGSDYWGGVVIRQALLILLGLSWIALVIGGGEYHAKKLGQPKSWKLFGRTLAVELAILALTFYI